VEAHDEPRRDAQRRCARADRRSRRAALDRRGALLARHLLQRREGEHLGELVIVDADDAERGGTWMPRRRAAMMAPIATSSHTPTIAVGAARIASRSPAAA
jgi:hypothetical protein